MTQKGWEALPTAVPAPPHVDTHTPDVTLRCHPPPPHTLVFWERAGSIPCGSWRDAGCGMRDEGCGVRYVG